MLTNLENTQVTALALPRTAAYTLTRRRDASATAFPWQADAGHNLTGAGTAGDRQTGTVEGWLKALEQSFGTCVRMILPDSETVLTGNGPVCRVLDDLHGPRALCRQVHRAVHAASAGTGCPQRVRCPLNFLLLSMPVQTKGSSLGQIELGPLMVEPFDRAAFARSLGRLGISPSLWPRLQSALRVHGAIHDEATEGVLALLQRVASVVADELARVEAEATAQEPIAVVEARRFAEQHLGGKIALGDVARHVALSADHFSRLFRCALGMPFGEYVNRRRVAQAQRLLAGSARRVAEVSYACGFESVPHFNRVFRRVTGVSPTRYRRQVRSL